MRRIILTTPKTPANIRERTFREFGEIEAWEGQGKYDKASFLEMAQNVGEESCTLLHDALTCTKDFWNKWQRQIDAHPGMLINGFCLKPSVKESRAMPAARFVMNYCLYFPPGMLARVVHFKQKFPTLDQTGPWADTLLLDFLEFEGLQFWQAIPSLVQTTNSHRKAPYFQ